MSVQLRNEQIAFVARETGYTLEYIRKIPYPHFLALVQELHHLKTVEEYNRNWVVAQLVVMWAKKGTNIEDIIGQPPVSGSQQEEEIDIWQMAKDAQIKVPTKRT